MSTPVCEILVKEEPAFFQSNSPSFDSASIDTGPTDVLIKTEIDIDEKSTDFSVIPLAEGESVSWSSNEGFEYHDFEPKFETDGSLKEGEIPANETETPRHPVTCNKEDLDRICPKCGRHFLRDKPFLKHKVRCSLVSGFECDLCPHKAKSLTCLKNHIVKLHQGNKESLQKVALKLKETRKPKKGGLSKNRHPNVTCIFCKRSYKSLKYLKRHMKRQCLFTCQECSFSCIQRKSFRIHSLAIHNLDIIPSPSSKFRCGLCGKKFINDFSIKEHCKEGCYPLTKNNNVLRLSQKKLHAKTKKLILKKAIEIANQGIDCSTEDFSVPSIEIKVEHTDEPTECLTSTCNISCETTNIPVIDVGAKNESSCIPEHSAPTPDENLESTSCSIQNDFHYSDLPPSDSRWSELVSKWGVEEKGKWKGLVTCTKCPMKFHNGRALSLHTSIRHGPRLRGSHYQGPWFNCPTCGSRYQSKKSLSIHLKYECNIEPEYECHYCGRRFHRKIKLSYHIQRNSCRREQFQCPNLCGGFFTQPYSFLRHLKTVCTRSATFMCNQCSKVFFRKDNLTAHMKRHKPTHPPHSILSHE